MSELLNDPSAPVPVPSPLDRIRSARSTERAAAAEQLIAALDYAHDHLVVDRGLAAGWNEQTWHPWLGPHAADLSAAEASGDPDAWFLARAGERLVPLAGTGAPLVAEFAPAELAGHLDCTVEHATCLIADALELGHRLPRLWALVLDGTLPAWRARTVTDSTRDLSADQATWMDAQLALVARRPERLGRGVAQRLAHETLLRANPHHDLDTAAARDARRGVWLHGADHNPMLAGDPTSTRVEMLLDTADALSLDTTLTTLAQTLAALGDGRSLDLRRATAVGALADPQHALNLLTGTGTAGQRRAPRPRMALYLHLDASMGRDTDTEAGTTPSVAVTERCGAISRATLSEWLGRFDLDLRPVWDQSVLHRPIDLDVAPAPVDGHDPTDAMREVMVLADETCVFPGCTRDSRGCDADHIDAYVPLNRGGPPGQTHNTNLAPLCRRHHRIKTHTAWDYARVATNVYAWTTPTGEELICHTLRRRC